MKPARTPTCSHGNEHTKDDTGGVIVVPATMGRARREACVECPLRKDAKAGYLGGYSPEMYLDAMQSPASIACHMSPGFQEGDIGRQNHCTGVAGFRANTCHLAILDGKMSNAQESTDFIGPDDRFFESKGEFLTHHKPHQKPMRGEGE